MNKNFKKDDVVYIIDEYTGYVMNATVLSKQTDDIIRVHFEFPVDRNENVIGHYIGGYSYRFITPEKEFQGIWHTAQEAFAVLDTHNALLKKEYLDEIKTVNDLVLFPLNHNLYGEDADLIAVEAYKDKIKDLLNTNEEDNIREF